MQPGQSPYAMPLPGPGTLIQPYIYSGAYPISISNPAGIQQQTQQQEQEQIIQSQARQAFHSRSEDEEDADEYNEENEEAFDDTTKKSKKSKKKNGDKKRLVWTNDLHNKFMEAIERLGIKSERARTPPQQESSNKLK